MDDFGILFGSFGSQEGERKRGRLMEKETPTVSQC